jgi:hypothetical protein
MKTPKFAPDIEFALNNAIKESVLNEFSEEDRQSGYAFWLASWWHGLPKDMNDEQARIYLGLL